MRGAGLDVTSHKAPICQQDVHKMYSTLFSQKSPWCLLYKVFFEITLHFARRGREGLRDLTKSTFKFVRDADGVEYVCLAYHEQEKTKQGSEKQIFEKCGSMYSQPGDPNCPVESLKLYLSKLNPSCSAFFQIPKNKFTGRAQTNT